MSKQRPGDRQHRKIADKGKVNQITLLWVSASKRNRTILYIYGATLSGVLRLYCSYRHFHTKHSSLRRFFVSQNRVGGWGCLTCGVKILIVMKWWWWWWSKFWVLYFYETFIYYRGCLNLNRYQRILCRKIFLWV